MDAENNFCDQATKNKRNLEYRILPTSNYKVSELKHQTLARKLEKNQIDGMEFLSTTYSSPIISRSAKRKGKPQALSNMAQKQKKYRKKYMHPSFNRSNVYNSQGME